MPTSHDEELIATRATLINRLKDWQDQGSWQDFFDTYSRLIYSMAIKAGLTPEEAKDIVQETTFSVAKHMPTFSYDPSLGSFKSWLLNLTRWRIVDHVRRKGRSPQIVHEEVPDGETQVINRIADPDGVDLSTFWDDEWEKNLIKVAVDKVKRQVDPQKFQVFDFYVNKGWDPEKVADSFGIATSQVYLIKHRITEMIRAEVQRLGNEIK